MNAEQVDVLSVIDVASDAFPAYSATAKALLDVRAVLADLIGAERELDASYAEFPPPGAERAAIDRAAARINAAHARRRSVLDRIGGAA